MGDHVFIPDPLPRGGPRMRLNVGLAAIHTHKPIHLAPANENSLAFSSFGNIGRDVRNVCSHDQLNCHASIREVMYRYPVKSRDSSGKNRSAASSRSALRTDFFLPLPGHETAFNSASRAFSTCRTAFRLLSRFGQAHYAKP